MWIKQICNHKVLRFCYSFSGATTFEDHRRETGFCWLGTLQLGRAGWLIQKTKPKLWTQLAPFATVVTLWTLRTLLIKLIRILRKSKHIPGSLAAMLWKRNYIFCEKTSDPSRSPRLECSWGKISLPGTEIWNQFVTGRGLFVGNSLKLT